MLDHDLDAEFNIVNIFNSQIIIEIQDTILIYNTKTITGEFFILVGEQRASYLTPGCSATGLDPQGLLQGRQWFRNGWAER